MKTLWKKASASRPSFYNTTSLNVAQHSYHSLSTGFPSAATLRVSAHNRFTSDSSKAGTGIYRHYLYQVRKITTAATLPKPKTFTLDGSIATHTTHSGATTAFNAASATTGGLKRRASSPDIFSTDGQDAADLRITPVNYGTSVFFSRAMSSLATSDRIAVGAEMSAIQAEPRSMIIRLTKQEASICRVLDRVAQAYETREGKKVQLRIAGGWVRDKLLGLASHDIDIGLDTMMGYKFAELVNNHQESRGHKRRTIAKIATNPEKSKHLETATMVVLGMSIDFVNLRSEVYDDSSRIPSEISFGSPTEDAYRRDITINALFYNIHTHAVEDYTGKGLDDLKNGLIRTPLAAFETFWQDPLRVLRCIRFAARFQFKLAEDAKEAILDPRIKQALKTKISKERIGAELEKMIDYGAGRSTALGLLQELGLYDVVFAKPEVTKNVAKGTSAVVGEIRDIEDAYKLVWIMEWLLKINPTLAGKDEDELPEQDSGRALLLRQTHGFPSATDHLYPIVESEPLNSVPTIPLAEEVFPQRLATRTLILAAMLYPYRDMRTIVNKKDIPAGSWVLRYGLKGRNVDIDIITKLMSSLSMVQDVVERVSKEDTNPAPHQMGSTEDEAPLQHQKWERAEIGMLIRDIGFITVVGKKWPCALLFGLGVELLPHFELLRQGTLDERAKATLAKYNALLSKAEFYRIDQCFSWKYLVDGKELAQLLNKKPSAKITGYLQTVMRWQLQHPQSSKENCQKWVLEHPDLFA